MDQLCALASELLENIRADGTAEDARRVFEHIMNSADLGLIVVAETNGTLWGYAYASYEWRTEFRGEAKAWAAALSRLFSKMPASAVSATSVPRSILAIQLSSARWKRVGSSLSEGHFGVFGFREHRQ